jgi:trans-aconitate 2-methyltransferase
MSWNPQQYLKFGDVRLRPIHDLLARVDLDAPRRIVDLGCGTGTVTAIAKARWPNAHITGVDNSQAMLDRARTAVPDVEWQLADLNHWTPSEPPDLIVSNAALHWLDDHHTLFPRLLSQLAPGGVLAVQMPAQHNGPSHQIGYDLAESPRWRERLQGFVRRRPILDAPDYYAALRPLAAALDLWFIEYVQALKGDHPVAEFTKGSFVGVWLAELTPEEAREFEGEYRARIAKAYPPAADGVTLFPFRRFFLVAQR